MAEIAALEATRSRLQSELKQVQQREQDIYREQRSVNSEIRQINAAIQDANTSAAEKTRLFQQREQLELRYNQLEQQGLQLQSQASNLQREIASIDQQIEAARNQQRIADTQQRANDDAGPKTNSAGTATIDAQTARDAGPQTPPQTNLEANASGQISPATTQVNSNAAVVIPLGDAGLNAQVRPLSATQATPASAARASVPQTTADDAANRTTTTGARVAPAAPNGDGTVQTAGVGSAGDDQARDTTVKGTIDTLFLGTKYETALPNVLSKYSSYTYQVGIYIMSRDDYRQLLKSKQRNISGFQLLMQSGGAPAGESQGPTTGSASVASQVPSASTTGGAATLPTVLVTADRLPILNRSAFFPLDYYIDDLQVKSLVTGRGVNGAHNVVDLKFKIIEPNGITLIPNLIRAAKEYVGEGTSLSYAAQNYLMVIRFYGYDQNGNLVPANNQSGPDAPIDPQAVVEKYIPFQFTGIKFRIANQLTEYDCTAICPQNAIGTGQARGSIPYNVQFTGKTLKDVLIGSTASAPGTGSDTDPNQSNPDSSRASGNTAPPPKASAAPSAGAARTAVGLCEALNRFQDERVAEGHYQYPDRYAVRLQAPIDNATIKPPGPLNIKYTPMSTSNSAAQALNGSKQSVKTDSKTVNAFAGQSVVQFLDQMTRNSSYIFDQQIWNVVTDSKGQQKRIYNGKPASVLAWYRIGMEAEPTNYDFKRKDWAYRITYQITPYLVSDVKSDYFVQSPVQVPHKEYNYWFTGQNSEVLEFSQDYNYLYYIVTNAKPVNENFTANYQDIEKRSYQPASNESDKGAENAAFEPGANAADYLYSPADTARIKMTIVGDPAWIQQGDVWSGVATSNVQLNYDKFLPDGTINYEGREIQFRVNFNTPADYDLGTGIMDPTKNNFTSDTTQQAGEAAQSLTYRAVTVTSMFSRGKFTQDLEGVQIFYDKRQAEQQSQSDDATRNSDTGTTTGASPRVDTPNQSQANSAKVPTNGARSDVAVNTTKQTSNLPENSAAIPPANQATAPAGPADPATSGTQTVETVAVVIPEVTSLPAGVTRDFNSGAFIYRDRFLVAGTNDALARLVAAVNSDTKITYADYDNNVGWVTKTYDARTRTSDIVGPAPDPNQVTTNSNARQQIRID